MKVYHDLLEEILRDGEVRDDRTGVGTRSVFGRQLRFDLRAGFPAITTKKLAWKACVGELLWFLEGSSDERRLAEITHGTRESVATIWTPNALAPYWQDKAEFVGDLGRVYGVQWRRWQSNVPDAPPDIDDEYGKLWYDPYYQTVDQVKTLVEGLRNDPWGRRHIISAWNPGELELMALPPCHVMSQFYVSKDRGLSCHMYQRSVDVFLGLPFNIASYALLTHMLAQVSGLTAKELIISTGDTHIYQNHADQVREQLTREAFSMPTLKLNPQVTDIDGFTMIDIQLENYQSHGALKAVMAV
jgi:thymidylate synthase